jgi:hypothetical protein
LSIYPRFFFLAQRDLLDRARLFARRQTVIAAQ